MIAVLTATTGLQVAGAQTETLDRILAIVDGQVIMRSDVRAFIALQLVDIPVGPDQESRVLTHVIERLVILEQVDRFVAEPAPELVDRRFGLVQDRLGGADALTTVLDRVGLTSDDLRQLLADDLRRDVYLNDRFAAVSAALRPQAQDDWVADLVRRAQVRRVSASAR